MILSTKEFFTIDSWFHMSQTCFFGGFIACLLFFSEKKCEFICWVVLGLDRGNLPGSGCTPGEGVHGIALVLGNHPFFFFTA